MPGNLITLKFMVKRLLDGFHFGRLVAGIRADDKQRVVVPVIIRIICLPGDIRHIRNVLQPDADVFFFLRLQVVKHNADCLTGLRFGKFGRHDVDSLFHGRFVRQVFCQIFVNFDFCEQKRADSRYEQHQSKDCPPVINDK